MPNLLKMAIEIREKIKKANEELLAIQEACSHPVEVLDRENHAHDGYAEPTTYTSYVTCGICGKFWIENQ